MPARRTSRYNSWRSDRTSESSCSMIRRGIAGARGRQIFDERGQARRSCLQTSSVPAGRVIDRDLDLRVDESGHDGPPPRSLLTLHVDASLPRKDQLSQQLPCRSQVGNRHRGEDVPGPLGLVHKDVPGHRADGKRAVCRGRGRQASRRPRPTSPPPPGVGARVRRPIPKAKPWPVSVSRSPCRADSVGCCRRGRAGRRSGSGCRRRPRRIRACRCGCAGRCRRIAACADRSVR